MPGYTHLQRAQPITFAHWALAYVWQLQRDRERLNDALKRINISPLGSGALAGNPFGLDREALARDLGFDGVTENSLDGVSDRDFVAELLFCCAMIGLHLSRLAEDMVLYSSTEFGFVTFADAYSTGSSIMPQKKNPDAMELTRGKSGPADRQPCQPADGHQGLADDLQQRHAGGQRRAVRFDRHANDDTEVASGAIATLKVNPDKMRAAMDPAMLATDVAEYLVRAGVPFRTAHHLSGQAVALAEKLGIQMSDAIS